MITACWIGGPFHPAVPISMPLYLHLAFRFGCCKSSILSIFSAWSRSYGDGRYFPNSASQYVLLSLIVWSQLPTRAIIVNTFLAIVKRSVSVVTVVSSALVLIFLFNFYERTEKIHTLGVKNGRRGFANLRLM
jgi:hypothetical protein